MWCMSHCYVLEIVVPGGLAGRVSSLLNLMKSGGASRSVEVTLRAVNATRRKSVSTSGFADSGAGAGHPIDTCDKSPTRHLDATFAGSFTGNSNCGCEWGGHSTKLPSLRNVASDAGTR
ncbi:hypothetical protein BV20DRAFT_561697 [Pilatotrama ljubarskyi]|nr:hypothetical protein BV20DRAFT_561697 [Pilatotrama ljubarskyi]